MKAEGVTFKTCTTCQGSGQVRKVVNTMLGADGFMPALALLVMAQDKSLKNDQPA